MSVGSATETLVPVPSCGPGHRAQFAVRAFVPNSLCTNWPERSIRAVPVPHNGAGPGSRSAPCPCSPPAAPGLGSGGLGLSPAREKLHFTDEFLICKWRCVPGRGRVMGFISCTLLIYTEPKSSS